MDYSLQLILLCLSLFFLKWCSSFHQNKNLSKLPPGPKPLPILGNILQLTNKPHQALAELAKLYGPLMYLQLGSVRTLVVSSSDMAKEIFLSHDLAFSSRTIPDAIRALDHHLHSVAWLPISPKWRSLRKISAVHLFTTKRLDESHSLRLKKVHELLEHVSQCSKEGKVVDVGEVAFTTSLNLLSNTFFSMDMASYNSADAHEFKDIVRQIFDCVGKPSLADFFPFLRYFDPLGIRRGTTTLFNKLYEVFDDLINQRMSTHSLQFAAKDDVLQTLLEISREDASDFSRDDVKPLLLDLICAGTDTTSSTVEWAMTELLRNPSKLEMAQAELDQILGPNSSVQESDIERLPYLQAIAKETMRLHPPAPLLLPRKAKDDIQMHNYIVPKDTQLMVNVWAIGRDPKTWKNPTEFLPERFLDCDIDMKGQDFELIPFGAGRRICVGMPLAYRMLHLMLAALLHGFKWRLADGLTKDDVDMDEKFGLTLQKAKSLVAIP